ncbi:MAG: hypothetical protein J5630_07480 [Bacteroidaceae bacterium]|nr:hypothetical protein [Bacteroidaceae bacterium]
MKRILLSLALLVAVTLGAQAQGAGLSQGQAVRQTTANPTRVRKTCSHCGITMGNITYAWQHESWCPYYRSSGGSSSSRSSSSSYGTYTAASAASYALGSLLSGLISSSWSGPRQTYDPNKEAREREYKENYNRIFEKKKIRRNESRKYWKYGDYEILSNGHVPSEKCDGCRGYSNSKKYSINTLSLVNTKTGKEIIPKLTEAIHKQYKSKKIPYGTLCLEDDNYGVIIYFFDSKQQESSPLLDGMLFVDELTIYNNRIGKKIYDYDYSGLCNIVNDSLQWLLKIRTPYSHLGEDFNYIPNSTCFIKEGKNYKTLYAPLKSITLDSLHSVDTDKEFIYVRQMKDTLNYKIYDMEFTPMFTEYPQIELKQLSDIGVYFLLGNEQGYGVIDKKKNVVIPFIYNSDKAANKAWNIYKNLSYTAWYKQEAAKYVDKKGEFEKTDHFEARMKDAKMQEEYLRDIMADAPERYLEEKVWEKGELQLTIGEYDADEECFPISVGIAPWNSIMLPVPISEAKDFKKEFASIKSAAAKSAQLGIRNDAPSIEAITFTTANGKKYQYGNLK